MKFFLDEAWPALRDAGATLHVIAGSRPEHFLGLYQDRVALNLEQSGIEMEAFVSDVRPAYDGRLWSSRRCCHQRNQHQDHGSDGHGQSDRFDAGGD